MRVEAFFRFEMVLDDDREEGKGCRHAKTPRSCWTLSFLFFVLPLRAAIARFPQGIDLVQQTTS